MPPPRSVPAVADAVARALMLPGNPSSVHAEGRAARAALEAARAQVAALVNARPEQVVFTSGGTEAANAVLSGALRGRGWPNPTRLLHTATEHPCVAAGHRFPDTAVDVLPVTADGVIDLSALEARLAAHAHETVLVSVHAANNETGAVQPLADVGGPCRGRTAGFWSTATRCRRPARSPSTWPARPRCADPVGPQIRGAEGRRRAGAGGGRHPGEPVAPGRRPGAPPALRHRGRCRRSSAWARRPGSPRESLDGEAARLSALRDRIEAGVRALAPDGVVFAAGARAPAQHAQRRGPGPRRARGPDRPRSRRRGGFVGLGLLLGEGRPLGDARRDGRRCGSCRGGAARQPRLEHGGRGCGMLPRRLRTGLTAPI